MPDDGEQDLWSQVATNREAIRSLENEQSRLRDTVHKLSTETAAILYLTREVGKLETAVEDLAGQLERVAKRALDRPTSTGLAVVAQYLAVVVALVALVVAATR